MRLARGGWSVSLCGALWLAPLALAQQETAEGKPIESGVVEQTGRRLAQLDVSFSPKNKGAEAALPELTPDDFDLVVNGRPVRIEYADRICNISQEESLVVVADEAAEPAPIAAPLQPATYIFYFEHTLLTMSGQNVALEMAERLIPELIVGGNRGMVVSSGGRVIQSELGEDPEPLLEAIRAIRKDPKQWSEYAYAQLEVDRYEEIFDQPSDGAKRIAARSYQLEEMRITSNRMIRLSALLGGLAEVDPPKAVFYFADMARKRPGEHFIRLFSARTDEILGAYSEGAGLNHSFAFDDVLNEANAQGVRLYTVQAQGLKPLDTLASQGANQIPNTRIRDAEETMQGFAAETGGEMFLGGSDASTIGKILRQIEEDFGCFYVLNFYPDELPEDQTLRVLLRLNETDRGRAAEEEFNYRTRGQLVVQSKGRREESLLLAAHAARETVESDAGHGVVIPLAYTDGAYDGLVQFVVRGSELAGQLSGASVWDLGMTHIVGPDVRGSVSARVEVSDPAAPVVLETLWRLVPGVNEIVSVGREHRLGQLATVQLDLDWPDPDKARATISPIAVVQQYDGVFLRKNGDAEEIRHSGTLAVGTGLVNSDRPSYLIELVCRGRRVKDDLWVRRRLSGEDAAEFELLKWRFDPDERCIQIRDLLHERQMGLGDFVYQVDVFDNEALEGEPVASAKREFSALGGDLPVPAAVPQGADLGAPPASN